MRTFLVLLVAAAAIYALFCGALFVVQRRIIYAPDTAPPDRFAAGAADVAEVRYRSGDGLDLLAWSLAPVPAGGFTVLYLHGNAGNIGGRGGRIARFRKLGCGVLMPEYRGYGGNPGEPTEAGLYADSVGAYTYLRAQGVDPARILVWGESLGTGLATMLAAEHPAAALLLESPYTSMADIARDRYPFVPVDLLLQDRLDALSRIAAVRAPVLVMQGGRDTIVPPAMGKRILAAATAPKELWHVAESGHNDLADHGAVEAAAAFVARHVPAP